jgi:DeoR/GlpR family transcriptional regulator of sugar metabolism
MSLTFENRKKTILGQLSAEEKVQVHTLAAQLQVSHETIRRDLDRLEKEGLLKKVYGGAVLARMESFEAPFALRAQSNAAAKAAIAKQAASLVEYGDTIVIDSGTTTLEIVRYLQDRTDVTLLTHSAPMLQLALNLFKGRLIFIGGEVDLHTQSAAGSAAESFLAQFKVHKAFISVGGISLADGVTDYDLNEARMSRQMMKRSVESIVLADHSKLGKTTFASIAPLHEVSMLITDNGCTEEWKEQLKTAGVELLIAEQGDEP